MKLAEFYYDLPADRIAQEPVSPRDHSRLMIISRKTGTFSHHYFYNLPDYLNAGDVLVVNATKVFPARLRGKKKTGGKVEVLLLESEDSRWRALVRGTTRAVDLSFPEGLEARMVERLSEGEWVLEFSGNHVRQYLDRHGEMPLPPYIKRESGQASDLARYQTVYAQQEGAIAAPTAGFHFTPELMKAIQAKGVDVLEVVLHVGWGTFRPVRTEAIEEHQMLPERYVVSDPVAQALTQARKEKRRIVAVGTTVTRTLESIVLPDGSYRSGAGESRLFIFPGYTFRGIDALITNFHLPDSTPLLLANAFYGGPESFGLKKAYEEAIRQTYRFYSYGDAMLIA